MTCCSKGKNLDVGHFVTSTDGAETFHLETVQFLR